MTTAEVLEKVKKLLALGKKSPYAGEAENALAAAQKLMLEHGLTSEQVDASDVEWVEEIGWQGAVLTYEIDVVAVLIRDYFFVEASIVEINLHYGGRKLRQIRLFGRPEDVAFAKYAYTFLCRTFRKRWNEHRKKHDLEAWESRGFFMGMGAGFAGKLHLQREEMERQHMRRSDGALIVVGTELARRKADIEAAYLRAHPGIGKKSREPGIICAEQFVAGVREGHQIELNRPLPTEGGQKRLTG